MIRTFLSGLLALLLLTACSDDGPSQAEFEEAMDGVLADPETYELEILECINDGEFITYRWELTNTGAERKTFAFDPYLTNSGGEEEFKGRKLVGDSVAPGQTMEWDAFEGGGERFPIGDVECRIEVVDSVLGLFRDEE